MERKGGSTTVEVKAAEVKAGLARHRGLTAEEEKVLRLRHGVGASQREALPQAAAGNAELADELLLMEMHLLRAFRAHKGVTAARAVPTTRNAAKDKIVRALRKKK